MSGDHNRYQKGSVPYNIDRRQWKYDPTTGEPLIDGWPLYSGLPRREWRGLTDEEMSAAMDYWSDPVRSAYGGAVSANEEYVDMVATWRYIEAKLRSKNES